MYLDAKHNIDKVTLTGYRNNYKLHVKDSWFGKIEIKRLMSRRFWNSIITLEQQVYLERYLHFLNFQFTYTNFTNE